MKNNEDILKRILLNMKYDPKKTLNENKLNIISENSNKCRNDYWWKMEKADPNNKSLPICWNGVDPLSCDLRKTLSNYKLHTAFISLSFKNDVNFFISPQEKIYINNKIFNYKFISIFFFCLYIRNNKRSINPAIKL